MSEKNRVLYEAQRNLSNVINEILQESADFKKLFIGVDDKGKTKEGKPYIYDPAAIGSVNLEQFAQDFPKMEPHLKFILSNTGLGGKHRTRMLKTLRKIRNICNRPRWLITDETRGLLRVLVSNLGSAVDGAISQTAMTRDSMVIEVSAKMTKDVSLQDVTRASIDLRGGKQSKPEEEKAEEKSELSE